MEDLKSRKYWSVNVEQVRVMSSFVPIARPPNEDGLGMMAVGYIQGLPLYEIDKE